MFRGGDPTEACKNVSDAKFAADVRNKTQVCQFIDATWHFGVIEAEPALIIKGNPLERGTSSFEEI